MPESLTERIQRLTNELNGRLKKVEEDYQKLNYGVSVEVNAPFGKLAYQQFEGTWMLIVIGKDTTEKPLLRCSRIIRAEALGAIPYLTKSLEQKALMMAKSLENALNVETS